MEMLLITETDISSTTNSYLHSMHVQRGEVMSNHQKFKEVFENGDLLLVDAPPVLFNPYRILIMKILYKFGHADFRDLKNDLNLTAGNLASHLRALKGQDYIKDHKGIVGNRPRTSYELTEKGANAYMKFKQFALMVFRDEKE